MTSPHPRPSSLAVLLSAALSVASCQDGPGIASAGSSRPAAGETRPSRTETTLPRPPVGTTTGGVGAENPLTPLVDIEYPTLTFNGQGQTQCGDQNLRTDTQIVSKLSKTELSIERANVHVECYKAGFFASAFGHDCDDAEFNAQILQGARGATVYSRYTLEDGQRDNIPVPSWAIMAKSIRSNRGEVYTLDKPIPVFPMPAALARYRDLDQPQTFTATVTGPTNAAVVMKVTKLGINGDVVKLRFELTLNGRPSDPALYDKFPIPHAAEFDVGTSSLDLRGLHTSDQFVDDKGCNDGGNVDLTYQLCRKQTSKKVEDTQAPYCQG